MFPFSCFPVFPFSRVPVFMFSCFPVVCSPRPHVFAVRGGPSKCVLSPLPPQPNHPNIIRQTGASQNTDLTISFRCGVGCLTALSFSPASSQDTAGDDADDVKLSFSVFVCSVAPPGRKIRVPHGTDPLYRRTKSQATAG